MCQWFLIYRQPMSLWFGDNWLALAVAATILVFIWILHRRDRHKNPGTPAAGSKESPVLEQAKLLFDYTKFHITVYTTIATLLVAATSSGFAKDLALSTALMRAAVVAIVGAGLGAGVVAASLPECVDKYDFWNWRTGPYNTELLTLRSWTFVEHSSFWLAVLLILVAFAFARPSGQDSAEITMYIKERLH